MNSSDRIAVFFGGCVTASPHEEHLAQDIGVLLAEYGYTLRHGGYNGLMEHAAKGASEHGAPVVAVSLQNMPWGAFNPHVTDTILLPTMGERMHSFLDTADVIVAMAGGIGTLHELTAALWYASNIRPVPVVIAGATARRLLGFLRAERWLYESPTRPLAFLHHIDRATDLIPHIAPDHGAHRSAS
ncbi:LOG family protein [Actinoplanes sp. NPDC051851]|uniref:LOG family protein n=1 Tax=Actinoplanes sp. NPDC051851 TaxID=3154753 RepID=UPI0034141F08